jgi:hypothetical protein
MRYLRHLMPQLALQCTPQTIEAIPIHITDKKALLLQTQTEPADLPKPKPASTGRPPLSQLLPTLSQGIEVRHYG